MSKQFRYRNMSDKTQYIPDNGQYTQVRPGETIVADNTLVPLIQGFVLVNEVVAEAPASPAPTPVADENKPDATQARAVKAQR